MPDRCGVDPHDDPFQSCGPRHGDHLPDADGRRRDEDAVEVVSVEDRSQSLDPLGGRHPRGGDQRALRIDVAERQVTRSRHVQLRHQLGGAFAASR